MLIIKGTVVNLGGYPTLDDCLEARQAVEAKHPNMPGILQCVGREGT